MADLRRVRIDHDCDRPGRPFPKGASRIWYRWRCPTCGQAWSVLVWSGGSSHATKVPLGYPNLRHWLWQRRLRRETP